MKDALVRRFAVVLLSIFIMPAALSGETVSLEVGMDRMGADYKGFALDSADAKLCQKACADDSTCKAFTYVKPGIKGPQAMCFLKSSVAPGTADACCTSGAKTAARAVIAPRSVAPMQLKPSAEPKIMTPEAIAAMKAAEDQEKDAAYQANQQELQAGYEAAADGAEQAQFAQECKVRQEAQRKAEADAKTLQAVYDTAAANLRQANIDFKQSHPEIGPLCASGGCDDKWTLQNYPEFQSIIDLNEIAKTKKAKWLGAYNTALTAYDYAKKVCDKVNK